MRIISNLVLSTCLSIFTINACAADTPQDPGYGANPVLPEVDKSLLPRVHTAKAVGWPDGAAPIAAQGLQVNAFAKNLHHPRWLYDELGNNLVPDYMTSVKDGAFYGWPFSYYGQHVDERAKPENPEMVAKAVAPDYALGSHTASLGLVFNTGELFPDHYSNGVFIGQHGSWNREPKSGYRVIFVPFKDGKPNGMPEDILSGFLNKDDQAQGRPVGVVIDKTGALLVADDVGNKIWRVIPQKGR